MLYEHVMLYEEFLTGSEILEMQTQLDMGHVQFGDKMIFASSAQSWALEKVQVENSNMKYAGKIISIPFRASSIHLPAESLLSLKHPYFPNVEEAARCWLEFSSYHGLHDSRNGAITILLPEIRAYMRQAEYVDNDTLEILTAGTDIEKVSLTIKGAYWIQETIYHFQTQVINSKAILNIPSNNQRLECYLIDQAANVYDFHKEDKYSRTVAPTRFKLRQPNAANIVFEAMIKGEGQRIEFKPFVEPDQAMIASGGGRSKLAEVIISAVAFANADGGNIYLGIDDDCCVAGIKKGLEKWGRGPISESLIARYLGTLKATIKDRIDGDVEIKVSAAKIDEELIVIVEVQDAARKPVGIRQDNYVYVRTGASNSKIPPNQLRHYFQSGIFS